MALLKVHGEMRVGSDPVLKFSQAGKAFANFRAVASARRQNDQTKEWETTDEMWAGVTVFGNVAEAVAEHVTKGSLILIEGRVSEEHWTNNEGVEKSSVKIIADTVALVVRPPKKGDSQPAAAPANDPWSTSVDSQEPPF